VQYYQHSLESSVIHSFSPYTEDRVREIMLEPRHEQRIYANRSVFSLATACWLSSSAMWKFLVRFKL